MTEKANENGTKGEYAVDGMSCQGCVRGLEAALEHAAPGLNATVTVGQVVVTGPHDPATIRQAIEDAGFDVASAPS